MSEREKNNKRRSKEILSSEILNTRKKLLKLKEIKLWKILM